MNELLKEFISYISEAPAKKITAKKTPTNTPKTDNPQRHPGESEEYPGYFKMPGFGLYATSPTAKKATHRVKDGEMVPVASADTTTNAAGGRGRKSGTPDTTNQKQKSWKSTGKDTAAVPTTGATIGHVRRLERAASPQGKEFISALEAGNVGAIRKLVDKLDVTVSKEGKIKAMAIGGSSGTKKLFGDNKNAPLYINKMLEALGLPLLPIETIPKNKSSDISVEELKPSTVFSDRPQVRTTVHAGGVKLGNSDYNILTSYPPNTKALRALMVERTKLSEIQNRYPGITQDEAQRKVDDINGIIDTHNARVRFLQAEIQRGGKFRELGSGKEAIDLVNQRLQGVLQGKLTGKDRKLVLQQLDALANAPTVEEFDSGWGNLNKTLSTAVLPNGSVPLICEHLTAMRNALRGASIMLPESDSFKLGDIIAYSAEGVNTQDVRSIVDGVQMIEVGLDIGSVKRDAGGASAVGSRTEASAFAGEGIPDVLNVLGRSPVKGTDPGTIGEIYGAKNKKELAVVEQKVVGVIKGRMKDIRTYYRIPETMSDDEVIAGLKTGNQPTYDKTGKFTRFGVVNPVFSADNPDGSRMTELNKKQLELYSLCGFAYDAVYNSNCTGQAFSNTTFKKDSIVVSDGIKTMGQSRFQFNKKMSWRNGVLRDDGIAAKIKPVPRTLMGTF